ncbi:hypothetical protein DL96DRAFT_440831 [Flagelloscypha sp. PMI_526]|nr:hypothetical protein DL96DRAFT_440831 [Flagelloscypha sp. PMI_526]
MESYKSQISELETKSSTRAQEVDALRFELDQTRTKLRIVTEERRKDSETLDLYQERVRELELTSNARPTTTKSKSKPSSTDDRNEGEMDEAELMDPSNTDADDDEDDPKTHGLGGELDDAISGTTMTDLKLQVRKLKRELEAVRKNEADASRILVLENLLEDANRMKTRYETDYLAAQREKLVLQRDLEEIRSGKSMGDGAEAAIALRQRLNESVDQLDTLRKEHAELEVKADTLERELTIAKSDLTLVNKDQLDILSSLRESVNEDKAGLETEMSKLKDQLKEASEKGRMQLEQINGLLLEKISLQSEGIGHREAMLQRERDYGDLRASISGKDLPEDIKQRLLALHEDNIGLKEAKKTLQEQLTKARNFIKDQDKLFKEQHGRDALGSSGGAIDEEAATTLRKEIAREKQLRVNMAKRYAREQELMLTYIHNLGMVRARNSLGPTAHSRPEPSAWLGQQRKVKSLALQRS